MSKYPEHEKLRLISDKSQAIFDFTQFLDAKGIRLATWHGDGPTMDPIFTPIRDLIAEFFEIDQKKLEDEKDEMLAEQRKPQQTDGHDFDCERPECVNQPCPEPGSRNHDPYTKRDPAT